MKKAWAKCPDSYSNPRTPFSAKISQIG